MKRLIKYNMKNLIKIFLFILFLTPFTFAQGLKIYGTLQPGNLLIGVTKNAKTILLDDTTLDFDTSGVFIFGFDRDAIGYHKLKVIFNNDEYITKDFKLEKRKYKVQRINKMKTKYVTPPKSALEKIAKESKMMKFARKEVGKLKAPLFTDGFIRPVEGGKYTGVYGSQRILNGVPKSPHNGVDIDVPKDTPVKATASGKVLIAGNNFYYNGNFVLIDHGFGLTTVYLHFDKLNVKTGDYVKKGDVIGFVGMTGRATGPHLHWGAKWYNKRIDPLSLLGLGLALDIKNQ
ncbi:MAG: hypothetical protein COW08_08745 [Ignavibacteriales bacterium CG12_big_fil_rev_8_21_14_0_65_30_8]|nr:MAG: hypothetical protein COW08_08745 [Ignavibacteriales bacterium CG12_big_fil_rev_8_21_14_0_65_30_8]